MELYMEILTHILQNQKGKVEVTFPDLKLSPAEIVDSAAYCALLKIQRILKDDTLDDPECFYRIEAIVHEFERLGSGCGARHDFG